MKYWCVTDDPDVLTGMRLAGVDGTLAAGAREVAAAVAGACADPDIAVLLVTEGSYALCRETLDQRRLSAGRPLVNIIPDSHGPRRVKNYITRLIDEAIGIKI